MKIAFTSAGLALLTLWAASGVMVAQGTTGTDEPAIPEMFPSSHYTKLIQRSPFSPASVDVAVADVTPDFAANLYVTGLAKIGGQDCVFIRSRDQQKNYMLMGKDPGPDGVTLVGVNWASDVGKSEVRIKQGAQEATVKFDEALIHTALPANVAQANPDDGGQPQRVFPNRMPGANRFNGGQQGQPGGFNRFRNFQGGGGNGATDANGGGNRRRVRIINNE
ncbi:MAG: hypothetical protein QM796_12005 [Chthoniobacteraceae bacterium]